MMHDTTMSPWTSVPLHAGALNRPRSFRELKENDLLGGGADEEYEVARVESGTVDIPQSSPSPPYAMDELDDRLSNVVCTERRLIMTQPCLNVVCYSFV